jgi:hypothetical protein
MLERVFVTIACEFEASMPQRFLAVLAMRLPALHRLSQRG